MNTIDNKKTPLFRDGKTARFWVDDMPSNSSSRYLLQQDSIPLIHASLPRIKTDSMGWPTEVFWDNMAEPLFTAGLADFLTIDGWVHYPSSSGNWIWSGRESALISFDSPQLAVKSMKRPEGMNKILAMLYNNMWEVNYLDDCVGEMEFQFDLFWKANDINPKEIPGIVQTYNLPPVVMLNPDTREDEHTFKRMNEIKQ